MIFIPEFNPHKSFKDHVPRFEHGGKVRKGMRKLNRPFLRQKALHVILRSSKAQGTWSFLKKKNENMIQKCIYEYANRFHVKVYGYANSGNHLHILLKAKSKMGLQNFLRVVAGRIPRLVMGAEKGRAQGRFWDDLVYSKFVTSMRQFENTSNYILKNTLEAFGIIPPRAQSRGLVKIDYQKLIEELIPDFGVG